MGAQTFEARITVSKSTSDADAFRAALENARFENGHGGYSGSLAEKGTFVNIHRARSRENAQRIVAAMMNSGPLPVYREEMRRVVDDKWGPAGAVRYPACPKTDEIIFFGWASS